MPREAASNTTSAGRSRHSGADRVSHGSHTKLHCAGQNRTVMAGAFMARSHRISFEPPLARAYQAAVGECPEQCPRRRTLWS